MIAFFRRLIPTSKLVWAVVVLIVVALIAIIFGGVGSECGAQRTIPVLVHVFDAPTGMPIVGARVTIIKASGPSKESSNEEYHFPRELHDVEDDSGRHGTTDASGRVRIEFAFRTDSTQRGLSQPVLWISPSRAWVYVTAGEYGSVVVPVRHEPTRRVGSIGELTFYVPIGLFPPAATPLQPDQQPKPSPNE